MIKTCVDATTEIVTLCGKIYTHKKIISNNLKQDYLAWIIYITNNPELKIKGLQHSLLAQNSDLVFNLDYSASMY